MNERGVAPTCPYAPQNRRHKPVHLGHKTFERIQEHHGPPVRFTTGKSTDNCNSMTYLWTSMSHKRTGRTNSVQQGRPIYHKREVEESPCETFDTAPLAGPSAGRKPRSRQYPRYTAAAPIHPQSRPSSATRNRRSPLPPALPHMIPPPRPTKPLPLLPMTQALLHAPFRGPPRRPACAIEPLTVQRVELARMEEGGVECFAGECWVGG